MTSKNTKAPAKAAPKAKKSGATSPPKSSSLKSKSVPAPKAKVASKAAVATRPAAKTASAAKSSAPSKATIPGKPSVAPKGVPAGKTPAAAPTKKPVAPAKAPAVASGSAAAKGAAPTAAKSPPKQAATSPAKAQTPVAPVKAVVKPAPIKPAPKPVPPPPPPPPPKKPGKGLNAQQSERMKQLLISRRSSLLDRKNNTELAAEDLGDSGGDSADRAAVSVDRDFMAESQARDAKMLQDIDEALGKISAGSYGICEECRCTIAIKRLEYMPNVAYCIECQEKLEEQGLYNDNSGGGPEDFRNVE